MSDEPFGTVFLTFDYGWTDADAEEELKPSWGGHREIPGEQRIEPGPDFRDATEAVQWWRDRGATRIRINLDGTEYLWAGTGVPPKDAWTGIAMEVFSPDDPRGRPAGASQWPRKLGNGPVKSGPHSEQTCRSDWDRISSDGARGRNNYERTGSTHWRRTFMGE